MAAREKGEGLGLAIVVVALKELSSRVIMVPGAFSFVSRVGVREALG